ncbi:hypothetical protein [Spirosoma areae]
MRRFTKSEMDCLVDFCETYKNVAKGDMEMLRLNKEPSDYERGLAAGISMVLGQIEEMAKKSRPTRT